MAKADKGLTGVAAQAHRQGDTIPLRQGAFTDCARLTHTHDGEGIVHAQCLLRHGYESDGRNQ